MAHRFYCSHNCLTNAAQALHLNQLPNATQIHGLSVFYQPSVSNHQIHIPHIDSIMVSFSPCLKYPKQLLTQLCNNRPVQTTEIGPEIVSLVAAPPAVNFRTSEWAENKCFQLPVLDLVVDVLPFVSEQCVWCSVMMGHWLRLSPMVLIMVNFSMVENASDFFRKIMRSNTWNSKYQQYHWWINSGNCSYSGI